MYPLGRSPQATSLLRARQFCISRRAGYAKSLRRRTCAYLRQNCHANPIGWLAAGFGSSSPICPASQSVSVGRSRFVRPVACDARVRSHLFVRRAQRLRSKQTLNFLDSILCTRPSAPPADRPAIYTRPGWTRKSRRAALLRHGRRRFRKIRKQGKKLARLGPKWTCGTSACLLTSPRLLI